MVDLRQHLEEDGKEEGELGKYLIGGGFSLAEEWSRRRARPKISLDIYLLSLYLKPIEKERRGDFPIEQYHEKKRRKDDEKVCDFDDFGFHLQRHFSFGGDGSGQNGSKGTHQDRGHL
jgi:hypothetical protein